MAPPHVYYPPLFYNDVMMGDTLGSELRAHDFFASLIFPFIAAAFLKKIWCYIRRRGTDTRTHAHNRIKWRYFHIGRWKGGGARSIREIPLLSYEVPVINLLVSIQPARSSVVYYIQHHNTTMLLQLMMQHNLKGYKPCSIFIGAPELPQNIQKHRVFMYVCVCVCVCARAHTHSSVSLFYSFLFRIQRRTPEHFLQFGC